MLSTVPETQYAQGFGKSEERHGKVLDVVHQKKPVIRCDSEKSIMLEDLMRTAVMVWTGAGVVIHTQNQLREAEGAEEEQRGYRGEKRMSKRHMHRVVLSRPLHGSVKSSKKI